MNLQTLTNRNAQKGFTIVELLIVIVVIAILAAISIAAYTGIQNRARESSAQSNASQIAKKADIYYSVNSSYPTGTTTATLETAFNGTAESKLEGLKLVYADAVPTDTPTDSEFTGGKQAIYVPKSGTPGGYTILYWVNKDAASSGTSLANVGKIEK